ncbi:MAG: DUF1284 domain-containing protein [Wolbachia endosymbiont of Andrena praecox]|nr:MULTISPECIES: DUF1284 domain-containing protein [unclassified Wolbachia]MDX5487831.1 DUF1284 domain-containing protein [Wolbachia endosymbiont of Andrena praecox]MDX5498167.1 DUF1284 domain-containing protein [Wolbachia endosymbiont of Lasioglossum nitidulum]MDX5510133.1 DUF1284 domain-containing protein [Wolbachia endosymbiont of Lasioglossum morio]MDX5542983.1 DUF1284 domain-containing protein [Wolbachia endosymbiont of Andrena apicata]MDX5562233.1 DUF1284 domain-containing protein [Wolba
MCTLAFRGYGYSQGFVENYRKIASEVVSTQIEVVGNLDSICSACPNQTKQGKCTTQAKVLELDRRHMEILGVKIGETLTWNEAVKKIREKMSLEKFEYACEGCNWQPYGICKNALLNLQR